MSSVRERGRPWWRRRDGTAHGIESFQSKPLSRFNAARCTVLGTRHRAGGVIFVTADAVKGVQLDVLLDKAGLLGAFDSNRNLICATASKVYARDQVSALL
jgi:hypothetical protein